MSCTLSKRPFDAIDGMISSPTRETLPTPFGNAMAGMGHANMPSAGPYGAAASPFSAAAFGDAFGSPPKRCRVGSWAPLSPVHNNNNNHNTSAAAASSSPLHHAYVPLAHLAVHAQTYGGDASPPHKSPSRPSTFSSDSVFRSSEPADIGDMDRFLPRRKRAKDTEPSTPRGHRDDDMAADASPMQRLPTGPAPAQKEVTYTLEQVRTILAKALQEREEQLRGEYDAILKDKLAEQFENFAKFNQDYVSRQMRESQWDYIM